MHNFFFEKFEFLADDSPDDLIYRRSEISREISQERIFLKRAKIL